MKPVAEWDLNYIRQHIIGQAEESLTLEFKQSEALQDGNPAKREIAKDVSSFANAAGGIIIYGIIETDRKAQAIDSGIDPRAFRAEKLDSIIANRIQPPIDRVTIKPIDLDGADIGRRIYVVEIPESLRTPHMVDNKYYVRRNFLAEPMEDFEVRAAISRSKVPDLSIELSFTGEDYLDLKSDPARSGMSLPFPLAAKVINAAVQPAETMLVRIFLSDRFSVEWVPQSVEHHQRMSMKIDEREVFNGSILLIRRSAFHDFAVFKQHPEHLFDPHHRPQIRVASFQYQGPSIFAWEVTAPGMPTKSGVHEVIINAGLGIKLKRAQLQPIDIQPIP